MKKTKYSKLILGTVFLLFSLNLLKSQDIVILKNGDEFKAKVDEVTDESIKYLKWENLNGAKYSCKKVDVFMIRYQNGYVEKFSKINVDVTEKPSDIVVSKEKTNHQVYQNAQIDIETEGPRFKFDLFLNTGEAYLFDIGNFKSDFCLSKINHKYADLGIGISRQLRNGNIFGVDLIFGLQNYHVNKDEFYYNINSALQFPYHIDDWYADDNLEMLKTGVMPFYTFQDHKKSNRFKIGLGISYTEIGSYGSFINFSGNGGFGYIDVDASSDPNWNIENIYKYEHKLSGKLGVEFNLGISYMPLSTYWYARNWNTAQTELIYAYYNLFQVKYGVGLMIY